MKKVAVILEITATYQESPKSPPSGDLGGQ